jgi:hypothetical protein
VRARLAALESARRPEGLDLTGMYDELLDPNPAWPAGTEILTDDHAPVNLLKEGK